MDVEEKIIGILKENNINTALTLPCAKIKRLLEMITQNFRHIQLTREENGVGVATGIHLSGSKSILVMQSSGIGNSVNALLSLAKNYEIPLPILISWRGIYEERIATQKILGERLEGIFRAMDIPYCLIKETSDLPKIDEAIKHSFSKNTPFGIFLSPKIWANYWEEKEQHVFPTRGKETHLSKFDYYLKNPSMTRFDALESLSPYFKNKIIVSNIGYPSRELFHVLDQPSNFYMLGSFGLVSSIGFGLALNTKEEVIVIDGDGSLLTNPNILCLIGQYKPPNLTIIAIDNGTHGSTGNQITPAYSTVDLELVARSFQIMHTEKSHSQKELINAVENLSQGPRFIHVIVKPFNKKVPVIPLSAVEIKERFIKAIT